MRYILLLIFSALGFANALFLHLQYLQQEKSGKKMFCILGSSCGEVVASKYGKTFGIKNEWIGFVFYTAIGILSSMNFLEPNFHVYSHIPLFVITAFASTFSLYLLLIQSFVLKKICFMCLVAIVINISLLILVIHWIPHHPLFKSVRERRTRVRKYLATSCNIW